LEEKSKIRISGPRGIIRIFPPRLGESPYNLLGGTQNFKPGKKARAIPRGSSEKRVLGNFAFKNGGALKI